VTVVVVMSTEAEEKLHVGSTVAPAAAVVIAQVNATVPVNEFAGVTVMVSVLVEPAVTAMLPLLESEKLAEVLTGACQKSPQPAKNGAAASNNIAHLPNFISTPSRMA